MPPVLTDLQFLVLLALLDGRSTGRSIRSELARSGINRSGPAFYQMMARLERAEFVVGSYHSKVIDGQIIRQRKYRLTVGGRQAYIEKKSFIQSVLD